MPLDPSELNPTDVAILDELHRGRCTPAFIAEKHGYTSGNVRNRMTHLASHDHVEGVGGGLYQLVDDPREGVEPAPDLEAARRALDELERAFVDDDRNGVEDALERARDALKHGGADE